MSFFSTRPDLKIQAYKLDVEKILPQPIPALVKNFLVKRKIKAVCSMPSCRQPYMCASINMTVLLH